MLLKDDKKGLVTLIVKKMKGHGDLSPKLPSSESLEPAKMKDGAEQDYEHGYDACCDDMIQAFKSGDSKKLKESLKSFISMAIDEQQEEM